GIRDDLVTGVQTCALPICKGFVAEPGLVGTAPGIGETIIAPVSVCHHVSTMGQRSRPIFLRYHIQASGLIGSPTVPSSRKLDTRSEERRVGKEVKYWGAP